MSLRSATVGVLLLAGGLFFARLDAALLDPEEARYAEIPRQMFAGGQWLVPHLHGQPYLDKPPLVYWLVMLSYQTFGVSDPAARFVAALGAWLTIALLALVAPARGGRWSALAGALVLTLAPEFVYRGRMLTLNGWLALFVLAALLAGQHKRWGWCGVCIGLGILTKGPVALVLALPLAVNGLAWRGWLLAGGGALLVAGPWFGAVMWTEPAFARYFFWTHHVQRYVDPLDHAEPIWFYVPIVLVGLLPWTLLLRRWQRTSASTFWLLAGGWAVLFFSLAGCKRACYLLPALPPLALGLGILAVETWGQLAPRWRRWLGMGTLTWASGLLLFVLLWWPHYCGQFSLRCTVQPLAHLPGPAYTFPRRWDAASFYLQRNDVSAVPAAGLTAWTHELDRVEQATLIVKTEYLPQVLAALPPGWEWVPRTRGWWMTGGVLRKRAGE